MSKSLGNVETIREVLDTWGRETSLVFFLTAHWRKPIDFSEETMTAARAQAETLRNALRGEASSEGDWGAFVEALEDDFNTPAALAIMRPFFPGADPNAPPPPDLAEPGLLEELASAAGLSPREAFDISWAYVYDDEDALTRSLLSAGGVGAVAGEREADVRTALVDVLAPYRTADGGYRLENRWHFLVATA